MIIIGTYLFLQSLKCRVERLYNIGSTTSSYDRRTAFFIQLVLRSFNDWFYLFYLPVVKWSFVSNRFRCYDCWMIVLNDPFFSHRMIIFDEPFSQSLNNHSNDRFWRTLIDRLKDPFSRVILVCDRSVFQRFLCCSDERSFLHTPVDNLSTISSDSFWKIVFNDPILRSSNDRVTKNAWCDCSAIISRDPFLRSVYDPVLQALTDHIKRR